MNSPDAGFRKASAASWGLVALSAVGAVGACALAYSDTMKNADGAALPSSHAVIEGTVRSTATTTTVPGFNGAPLAPGSGMHTRSHGS